MFGIRCRQRFDEAMVRLVQRGAAQGVLHCYHFFGDLNRALAAAMRPRTPVSSLRTDLKAREQAPGAAQLMPPTFEPADLERLLSPPAVFRPLPPVPRPALDGLLLTDHDERLC